MFNIIDGCTVPNFPNILLTITAHVYEAWGFASFVVVVLNDIGNGFDIEAQAIIHVLSQVTSGVGCGLLVAQRGWETAWIMGGVGWFA